MATDPFDDAVATARQLVEACLGEADGVNERMQAVTESSQSPVLLVVQLLAVAAADLVERHAFVLDLPEAQVLDFVLRVTEEPAS